MILACSLLDRMILACSLVDLIVTATSTCNGVGTILAREYGVINAIGARRNVGNMMMIMACSLVDLIVTPTIERTLITAEALRPTPRILVDLVVLIVTPGKVTDIPRNIRPTPRILVDLVVIIVTPCKVTDISRNTANVVLAAETIKMGVSISPRCGKCQSQHWSSVLSVNAGVSKLR